MVKTDSRAKYRRMILIYSLVIIIPGIFLSVLAFRGIYYNIAMAERIIDNRLDRKSKYYYGGIKESIETKLEEFYESDISWNDSLFIVAPGSKADKLIMDGEVLAAVVRLKNSEEIKFIDHPEISFPLATMINNVVPGDLYYHIKNYNKSFPDRQIQTPLVDYFEDSISSLLCTTTAGNYTFHLLFDLKKLLFTNLSILDEKESFPHEISWCLLDEYKREIWKKDNYRGKDPTPFQNEYSGHWTLQLEQVNDNPITVMREAEQQYLIAGFIFVIAVMGLGLVLTIRSLTVDYRLSQMKSDFVSTVSHEFKSPLTSIRMMSERLASNKVGKEERKVDYYNSMLAQSERLSHLVDNILDFSRMDRGKKTYHFEHINIVRIAREVIDYLLIRHKEMGFDIELRTTEDPLIAMADGQGIHQVMYNLVDNSIKYSGESRRIELDISRKLENVKITVKDYGIGISKSEQKKVFSQFFRSEKVSREGVKGSGIGLSIVREIVKAHNGNIELESEPGKGSAFTVYIPVNQK